MPPGVPPATPTPEAAPIPGMETPAVPGLEEQKAPSQDLMEKIETLERRLNIANEDNEELEKKVEGLEKKVQESIKYAVPERKEYEINKVNLNIL